MGRERWAAREVRELRRVIFSYFFPIFFITVVVCPPGTFPNVAMQEVERAKARNMAKKLNGKCIIYTTRVRKNDKTKIAIYFPCSSDLGRTTEIAVWSCPVPCFSNGNDSVAVFSRK